MNDLRIKPATAWNLLLALSLIAILGTGWYRTRKAEAPLALRDDERSLATANARLSNLHDLQVAAMKTVTAKTWDISAEALGSKTLERLTKMAENCHVQLTNFRSEKSVAVASLEEAPFTVVIDGPYGDALKLVDKLEAPESKLAVTLLQVANSDTSPGAVTATIGLAGFIYKEKL
jgi:hypothetical protein